MASRTARRIALTATATVAALLPLASCTAVRDGGAGGEGSTGGAGTYADGEHTVRGVYGNAPSYITVTATLASGTVTDVRIGVMPDNNDTSRGYQERFAAAIPDQVDGKPIDQVRVDRVAGASGCSDGFNDALAKIRAEASTES